MLKNYNYVLTILLYPFILVLSYLELSNLLKGDIYIYIIVILLLFFIPSFIMSLYSASEEILKSKKKWRIILLITLSIFYLPIYYTMYVSKEEKLLGFLLFIISIPLTFITMKAINTSLYKYFYSAFKSPISTNEHYIYYSKNKLFTINVDTSFRCNKEDIGDYVISCDRLVDDSFIGIYSYDVTKEDNDEIEEKLDFHLEQTLDYINENNSKYYINNKDDIIEINYGENTIFITQSNYIIDNKKYSLIIIKEMPREYMDYDEYQKMIDSIEFLNYN